MALDFTNFETPKDSQLLGPEKVDLFFIISRKVLICMVFYIPHPSTLKIY